jgi:hypothetical protein
MIWRYANKISLGPVRLINFLVLVVVVISLVPAGARWLRARAARPVVLCGQHHLEIFCLGIFLSVAAQAVLTILWAGPTAEAVVSIAGCAILIAVAWCLAWSKKRGCGATRRPSPQASS